MSAFGQNIRREIRSVRTAWVFSLMCLLGMVALSVYYTNQLTKSLRVFVINGDTVLMGWADPVAKSHSAIIEAATTAVKVIFGRVPERIEQEEVLERMVNTPVLKTIKENWNKDKAGFLNRQMSTEFSCDGDIKCLYINDDYVDALVTGHLWQHDIFEGVPRSTPTKMRVMLHFIVNRQIEYNHKFPLVVMGWEASPI